MSGHSDTTNCPNCGEVAGRYTDHKPFDYTSIECLQCGLLINPVVTYRNLEELNEARIENELDPITELPEQDESIF